MISVVQMTIDSKSTALKANFHLDTEYIRSKPKDPSVLDMDKVNMLITDSGRTHEHALDFQRGSLNVRSTDEIVATTTMYKPSTTYTFSMLYRGEDTGITFDFR